jgi:hypothetical protein
MSEYDGAHQRATVVIARGSAVLKLVKTFAIIACAAYVLASLGVRLFERRLLYQPGGRAVEVPDPALALAQRLVTFRSADTV